MPSSLLPPPPPTHASLDLPIDCNESTAAEKKNHAEHHRWLYGTPPCERGFFRRYPHHAWCLCFCWYILCGTSRYLGSVCLFVCLSVLSRSPPPVTFGKASCSRTTSVSRPPAPLHPYQNTPLTGSDTGIKSTRRAQRIRGGGRRVGGQKRSILHKFRRYYYCSPNAHILQKTGR